MQEVSNRAGPAEATVSSRNMDVLWTLLVTALASHVQGSFEKDHHQSPHDGNTLFLTPLISTGEAAERSKVEYLKQKPYDVSANSGYITVGQKVKRHLFFLHVRCNDNKEAPLILWLQGGPGESSLLGQFLENGPVGIGKNGSLFKRQRSLQENFNVIYLDQPAGAGYSFSDGCGKVEDRYPQTFAEIAGDMEEFLSQFLQVFPEYQEREVYVAGESYGAKPAIAIASKLFDSKSTAVKLKLGGLICGAGFFGSLPKQANSSDYLYEMKLITERQYKFFSRRFDGLYSASLKCAVKDLFFDFVDIMRGIVHYSGYKYSGNVDQSTVPPEHQRLVELVTSEGFRRDFHIGQKPVFGAGNGISPALLSDDPSVTAALVNLLEKSKVLVYAGDHDPIFPSPDTQQFFRELAWSKVTEFNTAPDRPWFETFDGRARLAGMVRAVQPNFLFASIPKVGHYPGFDKPREVNELIRKFVKGEKVGT